MDPAFLALIFGLVFWIPGISVLLGGLSLIYGIKYFIHESHESNKNAISVIGMILGIIGIFQPIFLSIILFLIGNVSLIRKLEYFGYIELFIPIHIITIILFIPIFLILSFSKMDKFKVGIIALASGFILSLLISLPHALNWYPPGRDLVEILFAILPIV